MRNYLLAISFLLIHTGTVLASGQSFHSLEEAHARLQILIKELNHAQTDTTREHINQFIQKVLSDVLQMPGSFDYSFDSLTFFSVIKSQDKQVRLYTWNLALSSGEHRFFGFIQAKTGIEGRYTILHLNDRAETISNPLRTTLSPESWYGARYYQVTDHQAENGKTYYTLLGWRGENMLLSKKVIDVFYFTQQELPVFGAPIFQGWQDNSQYRVIYQYSAHTSMNLRYEKQRVLVAKKWNSRTKKYILSYKNKYLIVCDRLIPENPQMEGQFEFYIPALDIADGFIFENGVWHYLEGIDARNL